MNRPENRLHPPAWLNINRHWGCFSIGGFELPEIRLSAFVKAQTEQLLALAVAVSVDQRDFLHA